ncbi:hypothetical protein SSE37_22834 [Sagittula stellata E-37]|uniref:Uncharacterized protein n=1 Tax=Sagittula stellata (strain ATCC 700073 / DSM 11524 / E-37) TaxID=388399 RepID=A3K012_SAGS3|nr:hypothetical protein SSE37_22834 [Sagittula stellata E-37]
MSSAGSTLPVGEGQLVVGIQTDDGELFERSIVLHVEVVRRFQLGVISGQQFDVEIGVEFFECRPARVSIGDGHVCHLQTLLCSALTGRGGFVQS